MPHREVLLLQLLLLLIAAVVLLHAGCTTVADSACDRGAWTGCLLWGEDSKCGHTSNIGAYNTQLWRSCGFLCAGVDVCCPEH
uniref:Uncharacterized protein n=1 Tax=Globodera rostochiensis TaxID=31243 RepID=A0A914HMG3_GLORO